jgi:hypothetical protein
MIVVQEHVVVSAQKDPVRQVRQAVISGPLVDVVGLRPAGRGVAVAPHASAVARRQSSLLPRGEEAALAPQIDDVSVLAERDGHGPGCADDPFDGFDRYRSLGALNAPVAGASGERLFGDQNPNRWRTGSDNPQSRPTAGIAASTASAGRIARDPAPDAGARVRIVGAPAPDAGSNARIGSAPGPDASAARTGRAPARIATVPTLIATALISNPLTSLPDCDQADGEGPFVSLDQIRVDALANEPDHRVVKVLLRRARVVHDALGPGLFGRVDETRPAAPR